MNYKIIYEILAHISSTSVLIPLFISILNFKTFNNTLKVLFFYLCISCLTELISFIMAHQKTNNTIVFLIFTVIEYGSFITLYFFEIRTKAFKMFYFFMLFLFSGIFTLNLFYFGGIDRIDTFSSTAESIILLFTSIYYFYYILNNLQIPKLNRFYFFWINSAILIYFSMSLCLFLFSAYILQSDQSILRPLWIIHNISNICFNLLIAKGIWVKKQA